MNKYLEKIAAMSPEAKKEIRDTGIIGAIGMGSSIITTGITDRLGITGNHGAKPGVNPSVSSSERMASGLKNPFKTVSNIVKNPGFKRSAKIGLIGGSVGLAGDYAAVKLMKHLDSSKNNI